MDLKKILLCVVFVSISFSVQARHNHGSEISGILYAPEDSHVLIEYLYEEGTNTQISGVQFGWTQSPRAGQFSFYSGLAAISVELYDQQRSFKAAHLNSGMNFMVTSYIGPYAEFGFDVGEEFLGVDENQNDGNNVDSSFAGGLVVYLGKNLVLRGYMRMHFFDGLTINATEELVLGGRVGFRF